MDYEDLSQLNKEFARLSAEMNKEFSDLFRKWMKRNPRLAIVNSIHMPANIILNMIEKDTDNNLPKMMPSLPEVFMRFAYPFTKLKSKWGKIPGKEFVDLYSQEYAKLFDKFFASEEEKKTFEEWFEKDKQNHSD